MSCCQLPSRGVRLSREISSWIIGSLLIDGLLSCSDGEEVSEKGVQTYMGLSDLRHLLG